MSNDIESIAIEIINKKNKNLVISGYRQLAGDFKQYKTS